VRQKSSNTLIINIIFNDYLQFNYSFSNNKEYRKCEINKLMQIKRIYLKSKFINIYIGFFNNIQRNKILYIYCSKMKNSDYNCKMSLYLTLPHLAELFPIPFLFHYS